RPALRPGPPGELGVAPARERAIQVRRGLLEPLDRAVDRERSILLERRHGAHAKSTLIDTAPFSTRAPRGSPGARRIAWPAWTRSPPPARWFTPPRGATE